MGGGGGGRVGLLMAKGPVRWCRSETGEALAGRKRPERVNDMPV